MNPVEAHLRARIAAHGSLPLDEVMAAAVEAYYAGRDPFGRDGDFTTAPEVSQMFGELVGLWLAHCWLEQGSPAPFVLAELGPGRGVLMSDALRAARVAPGFLEGAELWLVEASPSLRAIQAGRLGEFSPRWADGIASLPARPLFLVANEFFDALPISQHRRVDPGWQERRVVVEGERLAFEFGPIRIVPALDRRFPLVADGVIVEVNADGEAVAAELGRRIAALGGAALIIDYGEWDGSGDTLQAVRRHAAIDPLAALGASDLTAHVRFRALAEAAAPARAFGPTPQGSFLSRIGLGERAARLTAGAGGAAIEQEVRRLTDPSEMGTLFKAMALVPAAGPPPPGFESDAR